MISYRFLFVLYLNYTLEYLLKYSCPYQGLSHMLSLVQCLYPQNEILYQKLHLYQKVSYSKTPLLIPNFPLKVQTPSLLHNQMSFDLGQSFLPLHPFQYSYCRLSFVLPLSYFQKLLLQIQQNIHFQHQFQVLI